METIIGLLVILLPVIFKSIEKKLEKAGNYEQAKKIQDLARQMSLEEESPVSEPVLKPEPEPVMPVMPVMDKPKVKKVQPVQKVQKPSKKKDQPIVEKDTVKKEKIDARKMVVYSEIMKRKF